MAGKTGKSSPRANVRLRLDKGTLLLRQFGLTSITCLLVDLSETGCLCRASFDTLEAGDAEAWKSILAPGRMLSLELIEPPYLGNLKAEAEIRWIRAGTGTGESCDFGVVFRNMQDMQKQLLSQALVTYASDKLRTQKLGPSRKGDPNSPGNQTPLPWSEAKKTETNTPAPVAAPAPPGAPDALRVSSSSKKDFDSRFDVRRSGASSPNPKPAQSGSGTGTGTGSGTFQDNQSTTSGIGRANAQAATPQMNFGTAGGASDKHPTPSHGLQPPPLPKRPEPPFIAPTTFGLPVDGRPRSTTPAPGTLSYKSFAPGAGDNLPGSVPRHNTGIQLPRRDHRSPRDASPISREMQLMSAERQQRHNLIVPISYYFCSKDGAPMGTAALKGRTLNFSEGGFQIEGPPPENGEPHKLMSSGACVKILIAGTPQDVVGLCRLCAVDPGGLEGQWIYGLQISEMSEQGRRQIREMYIRAGITMVLRKRAK